MFKDKKRGFTLVEVVIVLALLSLIVLVVIPKVKNAVEVSNVKKDISVAINISNEAIILKKQGVEISGDSWEKASDIKVLKSDGSEKTLAECASVNDKAKAKGVKGCDFYVKLNEDGTVLVSVKQASKEKDENGEEIDTYVQVYPEIYSDEPYKSNY